MRADELMIGDWVYSSFCKVPCRILGIEVYELTNGYGKVYVDKVEEWNDAFIEKAEKWLNEHILDYVYAKEWGQGVGVEAELFDDFKKYMEGE